MTIPQAVERAKRKVAHTQEVFYVYLDWATRDPVVADQNTIDNDPTIMAQDIRVKLDPQFSEKGHYIGCDVIYL